MLSPREVAGCPAAGCSRPPQGSLEDFPIELRTNILALHMCFQTRSALGTLGVIPWVRFLSWPDVGNEISISLSEPRAGTRMLSSLPGGRGGQPRAPPQGRSRFCRDADAAALPRARCGGRGAAGGGAGTTWSPATSGASSTSRRHGRPSGTWTRTTPGGWASPRCWRRWCRSSGARPRRTSPTAQCLGRRGTAAARSSSRRHAPPFACMPTAAPRSSAAAAATSSGTPSAEDGGSRV